MDCKLNNVPPSRNPIIIGEIVGIYINNQFIKDGRIDSIAMQYVGRLGYAEYTTIKSKFKLD